MKLREIALLALLMAIQFIGPFSGNLIMPMFKALKEDFQVEIFLLGLSITLYMIPYSIVQLFAGFIGDLFLGRKRTIILGLTVQCIGACLIALSTNIWIFIFSRLIQGLGGALVTPNLMALVGDLYPMKIRGRVMGLMAISVTIGSSLGPLAGGLFASINWRYAYILIAVLSGLYASSTHLLVPEIGSTKRRSGIMSLSGIRHTLLNRNLIALCSLGFILFLARIGFITYLSDYLALPPYNLESSVIGAYLSLSGFGGIISGIVAGYLVDRIGRKRTSIIGFTLYAIVLSTFLTANWYEYLPILMLAMGFTSTMSFTPVNTMIVEVAPKHRGIATSIYGFIRFLGYAAAPIIAYPLYMEAGVQGIAMLSTTLIATGLAIILLAVKASSNINVK